MIDELSNELDFFSARIEVKSPELLLPNFLIITDATSGSCGKNTKNGRNNEDL